MTIVTLRRVGLLCLLATSIPTTALATGGKDIRSAPTVPYGVQQFGNTVTDAGNDPGACRRSGPGNSWWLLPVATGDRVTIDLEGQTEGDGFTARVYPDSVNDFNLDDASAFATEQGDHLELVFTAPTTTTMPFDVVTCDRIGSYSFTAYVKHAVRLGVPKTAKLARSGILNVGVHTPDGGIVNDPTLAVTLQAKKRTKTKFKAIGTATVTNGVAGVSFTMPSSLRKQKIDLRAVATGANYVTQTSSAQKSKVK